MRTTTATAAGLIAVVTAVGAVALPGFASADTASSVYRAELAPVDPADTELVGSAVLVDAEPNNIVTVHVEGLQPGVRYPWHVHETPFLVTDPCAPGAHQGPIITTFAYKFLEANDAGRSTATAQSTKFAWSDRGYYVNIHDPQSLLPTACGTLAP